MVKPNKLKSQQRLKEIRKNNPRVDSKIFGSRKEHDTKGKDQHSRRK